MARSLRIVHCFRSPVGGIFRHVRDLTHAQVAAGHKVGIICDSTTGGAFEEKLFADIEPMLALGVRRTPMQRHIGPGDIAAAFRTFGLIRGLRPDVLHGHGAKGGVYARVFGTLLRVSGSRVARLYSPHGGSLHYDRDTLTGKLFFALEKAMDRFTDHLLFVSGQERDTFRRKIGEPHAANSLVYNGLSNAEFDPVGSDPDAADFLYIGMMRDLKGPDLFIDALALAEKSLGRPLTAVMVGDGEGLPSYRQRSAGLGLAERIRFLPAMPARAAFRLGKTMVVPSRAEAMPYIVLESLAGGKPLIATSVGGIPEIFAGRSDRLISPDADAIARKMVEAAREPEAYAAAMPQVSELRSRFGADVMAAAIETAYLTALGGAQK